MTQTTATMGAEIMAQNAATSDYYKSLTDRGIDPHAPAGPDRDDLDEMGFEACTMCDDMFESRALNEHGQCESCEDDKRQDGGFRG